MIDAIDDRYNELNPPIDVIINAHGIYQRTDDGDIPHPEGAFYVGGNGNENQLIGNNENVQKFAKSLNGKIKSLYLVACGVARNLNSEPPDDHLMEYLATGLSTETQSVTVSSWDTALGTYSYSTLIFFNRVTYWYKVDVDGQLWSVTRP